MHGSKTEKMGWFSPGLEDSESEGWVEVSTGVSKAALAQV